jgi:hypothetical protein
VRGAPDGVMRGGSALPPPAASMARPVRPVAARAASAPRHTARHLCKLEWKRRKRARRKKQATAAVGARLRGGRSSSPRACT